jgi:Cu/Ag efflux pump CusA
MEAIKSRRTNIFVLLLSVGFLFLAGCAFAQSMEIERYSSYNSYYKKSIITKYPSYNLEFVDGKDTTYFSVFSDSIYAGHYGVRLYAYFSKTTDLNNSIIKIGFEDGSEDYIAAFEIDHKLSYVEYAIPQNVFNKLFRFKVVSVQFNYMDKINKIEDSLYFFAFLSRAAR